jgi:predicted Zn-dependent peptidase
MDSIVTKVKPAQLDSATAELRSLWQELGTDPRITDFELQSAKSLVLSDWAALVHERRLANTLLSLRLCHPDRADLGGLPSRIVSDLQKVTVQQMNEFAQAYFQDPPEIWVFVGPVGPTI